ncbi:MAG: hypothetical protein LBG22_10985 [Treponema sp.]|jgi:choline kinase|nr:hypothetical protein [Treponema sp.]
MKEPVLVVMAAGMGSRYGGLKQIDRIGRAGEVLLDYSVYDALRSGFAKVVFIIRHDIEADFREVVLSRMEGKVDFALAFQELDSLIPAEILAEAKKNGRSKPWGTAHALLCAEKCIDAPFAVVNADDFYGREAYAVLGKFLRSSPQEGAIVPFRLEQTLSPRGTVTRGICVIKNGRLEQVEELKLIEKQDGQIFNTENDGKKRPLAPDAPASMNFWGFPASVFSGLQSYFEDFLKREGGELKSECYVPLWADWLVKTGKLNIKSLEADSEWFGVTYREDREIAQKRIAELTAAGVYPEKLWS